MSLKLCIFSLLLLPILTSCHNDDVVPDLLIESRESLLVNEWIHAYEGSCTSSWMMFATDRENYLPTWQLRNRLELYQDHSAVYTIDTPCDPYYGQSSDPIRGQWKYDQELKTLEIIGENGKGKLVFTIMISRDWVKLMYKELDREMLVK